MLSGKEFLGSFSEPPHEYYPVPWWTWKGSMEFDEMLRQLDLMQKENIHEFFIFPSSRLEKPAFLSEEWFQYVEFTLKAAEARGMRVWLYDDLNWPSGAAGGYAVKAHPELREFDLVYSSRRLEPGEFCQVKMPGLLNCVWENVNHQFRNVELDRYHCFTNSDDAPGTLHLVHRAPCHVMLLNTTANAYCWGQRGQLSLVNPEAFRVWMRYVHEAYEARFGHYFGNLIRGFFIDEPQLHEVGSSTAPYDETVVKAFRENHGYDPEPHYYKLFAECPEAGRFRRDYYAVTTECFSANLRMLREWCTARNLHLTGHAVWEEFVPDMRSFVMRSGDPHRVISQFSIPGCDLLGHLVPFHPVKPDLHLNGWSNYGSIIYTAKYVSSSARWSGAQRTICEAFGSRNFHSGLPGQKLISDFLAAMGINMINDNLLAYTIADSEAGGKSFSASWWHLYHRFTGCSARLSLFAATGRPDAKTAVLVPVSTVWSRTRGIPSRDFAATSALFNQVSLWLLRHRIEFEYIFEDTPGTEELRQFQVILLPMAESLNPDVISRLQDFQTAGGRVLAIRSLPEQTEGEGLLQVDALVEEVAQLDGMLPEPGYSLKGDGVADVLSSLRRDGDERFLLLANQTEGPKRFSIEACFGGEPELLDPEEGGIYSFPDRMVTLETNQSIILHWGGVRPPEVMPRKAFRMLPSETEKVSLELSGEWAFDFEKRNTMVPALRLRFDPNEVGLKERWFDSPPQEWFEVEDDQFPMDMAPSECAHYFLRGTFSIRERVPSNLALVCANETVEQLFVNGCDCGKATRFDLFDFDNRSFSIAGASHVGENEFFLRMRVPIWNDPRMMLGRNLVPTICLLGDFAVGKDGALIAPPTEIGIGPWSAYGFPTLPGRGIYRKTFVINDLPRRPLLVLENAASTVEVILNGKSLTPRCWQPWRFALDDALVRGENTLEICVSATFGNLLNRGGWGVLNRAEPVPYGILGEVRIIDDEA